MNEISPEQLLSQIRTLSRQLQPSSDAAPAGAPAFADLVSKSLASVNAAQQEAGAMKAGFVAGSRDKTLAEVMIAAQKADMQFRAVTEVRNKLISAYQEIMNMPV